MVADVTNDRFQVIENVDETFLIFTNQDAPNGRVVLYDPETGWKRCGGRNRG